ncbi:hypothetical protein [Mycoplasma todarodis]|uniref:Uncharacterized protein n=1 Tax=Mycoplasma todarodis TaxID=1937191 RepID=A0A4R0XR49_9MOLU|nr:hypothetical protein [Mycoplasma todarodis]TCG12080.1 hypothetical protein C4B25_00095 [Mycoplasma todarodis]
MKSKINFKEWKEKRKNSKKNKKIKKRVTLNYEYQNNFLTENKLSENIEGAKEEITQRKLDETKLKNVEDIIKALNNKKNIFIIGENGVGKSTVAKMGISWSESFRNFSTNFFLLLLFPAYYITHFFSRKNSAKIKNAILSRRQKTIRLNFWNLFSLKNLDDYPSNEKNIFTVGIDEDKKRKKYRSYDSEGQITHLYIKKMIWGTIINALKPKRKQIDLERILREENFEEGCKTSHMLSKTIGFILFASSLLLAIPVILFYALNGFDMDTIQASSDKSNWVKALISGAIDIPLTILMYYFKKWLDGSKTKNINDFLVDQSNNIFIAHSLEKKSRFKVITIHLEDLDRLNEWLNSDGVKRTNVIFSILENINLLYNANNVRFVIEIDLLIWGILNQELKNKDGELKDRNSSKDFGTKLIPNSTFINNVNANSLQNAIKPGLRDKIKTYWPDDSEKFFSDANLNFILKNISEKTIKEVHNDRDLIKGWRQVNKTIPGIKDFICDFLPFLVKNNLSTISNNQEIIRYYSFKNNAREFEVKNLLRNKVVSSTPLILEELKILVLNNKSSLREVGDDFTNSRTEIETLTIRMLEDIRQNFLSSFELTKYIIILKMSIISIYNNFLFFSKNKPFVKLETNDNKDVLQEEPKFQIEDDNTFNNSLDTFTETINASIESLEKESSKNKELDSYQNRNLSRKLKLLKEWEEALDKIKKELNIVTFFKSDKDGLREPKIQEILLINNETFMETSFISNMLFFIINDASAFNDLSNNPITNFVNEVKKISSKYPLEIGPYRTTASNTHYTKLLRSIYHSLIWSNDREIRRQEIKVEKLNEWISLKQNILDHEISEIYEFINSNNWGNSIELKKNIKKQKDLMNEFLDSKSASNLNTIDQTIFNQGKKAIIEHALIFYSFEFPTIDWLKLYHKEAKEVFKNILFQSEEIRYRLKRDLEESGYDYEKSNSLVRLFMDDFNEGSKN